MALSGKKTVEDVDLNGKTVLMRVDYNVPFHPGTTEISDDSRIRASIPTIKYLLERKCRLVICSHIGRPKGRVVEEMRMEPTSRRLSELLSKKVAQAEDCMGPGVEDAVKALAPGEVLVLENLRYHPGEEANDPDFAKSLASLAELYVDDAFGTAHRAHASTEGVTRYLPSVAGLLMARELAMLGDALDNPLRPFAAILGGAKVSDKIAVLENLAGRVDTLIVGGGMAATFLKAQGLNVGDSLVEDDRLEFASDLIETAKETALGLLLPTDVVIADEFSEKANHETVRVSDIPQGWRVMDIGPETAAAYAEALMQSKTVIWNGPMGVFEWEPYAQGTIRLAKTLASLDATTVVGGGSTAEAVQSLGLAERMTHVSTGGGASLEFMEGRELPGVAALMDRD
ncbi:MAG: phosphoglycerate kinase [Chloroflexi bacterium]|nr:phosphoglycerate kinase [Chloroflexota bacterium]